MNAEKDQIEMSWLVQASPDEVFEHWLENDGHSAMTGGSAQIDPSVGGSFTAWDGYIRGVTKAIDGDIRTIVQSWRTADFSDDWGESEITVHFREISGKTQVMLRHTQLEPGDGAKYTSGWYQFYLQPMQAYFENRSGG